MTRNERRNAQRAQLVGLVLAVVGGLTIWLGVTQGPSVLAQLGIGLVGAMLASAGLAVAVAGGLKSLPPHG